MAYTYDDFVNAARTAGMYDSFSQDDLTTAQTNPEYGLSLLKLQQDAGKATTEEQKLLVQEAVNQLRKTYSGMKTNAASGTASSSYDNETAYQKVLDSITDRDPFSFDYRTDPTFGAMKESWIQDGDRTTDRLLKDTTVPQTSWAGAAAQQSNNYYDAKLNDQIPAVHQKAYEEYLKELNKELGIFDALATDKNFDNTVLMQQKQLDQQNAMQEFQNAIVLSGLFGTAAPSMPNLTKLKAGKDTLFTYDQQDDQQKALDAVVNQKAFEYDNAEDPLFQSLRKTNLREGDRLAADTLAGINARTGGVASSYGIRAASDAGNAYNESLNAAIPDLRQNAYQEYLGEFDAKMQALGKLEEDRAMDFETWLQDYQMKQAQKQQMFDNALALYEIVGLTPEIAAILGVPYVAPVHHGGGSKLPPTKKLSYKDIRNGFFTGLSNGKTQGEAGQFLLNAVNGGHITAADAQKIASGYTAGEKMWDRHG